MLATSKLLRILKGHLDKFGYKVHTFSCICFTYARFFNCHAHTVSSKVTEIYNSVLAAKTKDFRLWHFVTVLFETGFSSREAFQLSKLGCNIKKQNLLVSYEEQMIFQDTDPHKN